jgi:hypothetical protein
MKVSRAPRQSAVPILITLETGSNVDEVELLRQVLQGHIERKGQCMSFCIELLAKLDALSWR